MLAKTLLLLLPLIMFLAAGAALAQAIRSPQKQVVQLSGRVVRADSLRALEGVAVFVPGTTRGTHSRQSGFFSMPVVAGDSVVFGGLGYEKQYVRIPADVQGANYTVEIVLKEQSTRLPTVEVMPWATEYDLKQAVLRTRVPVEPGQQLPVIPPPYSYKSVLDMPPMSASQNFRYGQQLQQQGRESRYRAPDVIRIIGVPIR